jgi:hypothetical protein
LSDLVQPFASQVTVSSTDALSAALKTAHAGDTILLAPGTYAPISVYGMHFDGAVTIQSADNAHQAVLNGITFNNSSGLALNNVNVAVAGQWAMGVTVMSSANISLTGLKVYGTSGSDEGVGVSIRSSTGVTVAGSDFTKIGAGIGFLDSDSVTVSRNTLHDIKTDGILGAGSTHVMVEGNSFTNFHPEAGDHPDAIQFFGGSTGAEGSDVTIRDNIIDRGSGDPIQGIFIESTKNIVISGNAMTGTAYNGISLSTTQHALVENNFVQGYDDMGSRIITRGQSSDVTVVHNTSQFTVTFLDGGLPLPNYLASDNTTIAGMAPTDTSTLKTWLLQHGAALVVGSGPVTSPVDNGGPPLVNTSGPVIDTHPVAGFGSPDYTQAQIDHIVQEAIAAQGNSLIPHGWVML